MKRVITMTFDDELERRSKIEMANLGVSNRSQLFAYFINQLWDSEYAKYDAYEHKNTA